MSGIVKACRGLTLSNPCCGRSCRKRRALRKSHHKTAQGSYFPNFFKDLDDLDVDDLCYFQVEKQDSPAVELIRMMKQLALDAPSDPFFNSKSSSPHPTNTPSSPTTRSRTSSDMSSKELGLKNWYSAGDEFTSGFRDSFLSVHDRVMDGFNRIFADTLDSLSYVLCPVGKARRKDKDSSGPSGSSGVVGSGTDEGKLYLEGALLERHINETELRKMIEMPPGLDEHEWISSHTIAIFEHINLVYGTVSEYCTSTSCSDMTAPCNRTYLWFDEKGKKVKVAAPQYIDYVMTFIQKTINDESIFPTKSMNAFPSSFMPIVKKIFRLMFHVIAHVYHCHFKEIVLLSLHAHLNCVFAHFMIFNETFQLVEEKETEILKDLCLAMKLSDINEDEPMNESNKENMILPQSSSSNFPPPPTRIESDDPPGDQSGNPSSAPTFSAPNDDSILLKESALVKVSPSNSQ